MSEFHINLGGTGHMSRAEMSPPVETKGPLTKVSLTNGHPNTIHITEKTDGSKLGFRGSSCLGHEGDDGGGYGLGPAALGLPTVIAHGKGLEPGIREGG